MAEKIWLRHNVLHSPEQALVAVSRPSLHYVFHGRTSINLPFFELVLSPAKFFKEWTTGLLYLSPKMGFFYEENLAETRDQVAVLQGLFDVQSAPAIQVTWGATEEECAIVVNQPCFCTEPIITPSANAKWRDVLEFMLPGYTDNYDRRRIAKMALLRKINPLDSLAELEKQVDLLTAIVLELMPRTVPEAERPAWWGRFISLATEYDSTAPKGRDAALDDVEAQKRRIRSLIATYYEDRNGA
jgi:hypothetical protein